jgi:hypothetical protein
MMAGSAAAEILRAVAGALVAADQAVVAEVPLAAADSLGISCSRRWSAGWCPCRSYPTA